MIKLILSFQILLLFSFSIEAKPIITLMTSLPKIKVLGLFNYRVDKKLEREFIRSFEESGYEVRVIHRAKKEDLNKVLKDPKNIGLFWVSHSGGRSKNKSLGIDGKIVDIDGTDVKELFKKAHPNLKFLGLVGCKAKSIIDNYRDNGFLSKNLKVFAFDKTVEASEGLQKAIEASLDPLGTDVFPSNIDDWGDDCLMFDDCDDEIDNFESYIKVLANPQILSRPYSGTCIEKQGYLIKVERSIKGSVNPRDVVSVTIEINNENVAFSRKLVPNETSYFEIMVDRNRLKSRRNLHIKVISGAGLSRGKEHIILGDFKFSASWNGGEWQQFTNSKNKPIGVSKHIYFYKGALPKGEGQSYMDFTCPYMEQDCF